MQAQRLHLLLDHLKVGSACTSCWALKLYLCGMQWECGMPPEALGVLSRYSQLWHKATHATRPKSLFKVQ